MLVFALLVALLTAFILMNIVDPKNDSLRWYSGMVLLGIFTALAVFIREYILINIHNKGLYEDIEYFVYFTLFTCSIFGAYPLVMFSLVYSQYFRKNNRWLKYILIIPLALEWIVFPVTKELQSTQFLIIALTETLYFLGGCYFLIITYYQEKISRSENRDLSHYFYIFRCFYLSLS